MIKIQKIIEGFSTRKCDRMNFAGVSFGLSEIVVFDFFARKQILPLNVKVMLAKEAKF